MKSMAHVLRNSVDPINLGNPLCHLAKHPAVIHFLESFTFNHVAADLPYEQDHGGGILIGRMHADTRIGRTGPPCDKTQTRAAGKFAVCFSHECSTAFLPAHD